MIYWIAHGLFTLISKLFFPVKVSGRENLPPSGGYIIASNHLSNLDPMLIGLASSRRLNYMAKESIFHNRLMGLVLPLVGAFPINRSASDIGALKEAIRRLKGGGGLLVFPEGTRKAKAKEKVVQQGIGFLAVKAGVPVVPAYIVGSDHVLPPGSKKIKWGRIQISFGKLRYFSKEISYPDIADRIMKDIEGLSS